MTTTITTTKIEEEDLKHSEIHEEHQEIDESTILPNNFTTKTHQSLHTVKSRTHLTSPNTSTAAFSMGTGSIQQKGKEAKIKRQPPPPEEMKEKPEPFHFSDPKGHNTVYNIPHHSLTSNNDKGKGAEWKSVIVVFFLLVSLGYNLVQYQQLRELRKASYENAVKPQQIVIPVLEDKMYTISVIEYLNRASRHFGDGTFTFVKYDGTSNHVLGLYNVVFKGRLESTEEEMIEELKQGKFDNTVLLTLRWLEPLNKNLRQLQLPHSLSGYKCGGEERRLHLDLTYFYFTGSDEKILPFSCGEDPECDPYNGKQLAHFFNEIKQLFNTCEKYDRKSEL